MKNVFAADPADPAAAATRSTASRIYSCMVQALGKNRDIGTGEATRLISGGAHYHSSFFVFDDDQCGRW